MKQNCIKAPAATMLHRALQAALEAGSEVSIVLRDGNDYRLHGRVQDLDDAHLALFHPGEGEGWLWTIPLAEVKACALVVPRPSLATPACPLHP